MRTTARDRPGTERFGRGDASRCAGTAGSPHSANGPVYSDTAADTDPTVMKVGAFLQKHDAARRAVRELLRSGGPLRGTELPDPDAELPPGARVLEPHEGILMLSAGRSQDWMRDLRSQSYNSICDAAARDHGLSYSELLLELNDEADRAFIPRVECMLEGCNPSWYAGIREALVTMASIEIDRVVAEVMDAQRTAAMHVVLACSESGFLVCGAHKELVQATPWHRARATALSVRMS